MNERGVCDFTVKVQNVEAKGYAGAIVVNRTGVDGCETLVTMLVEANIPTDGQTVDIRAVFDGWGYIHQYNASTMQDVDQYALPEGQDPAYAEGLGDLSVHEVATDPDPNLAYISHYAGGFRVLGYGPGGLKEVGRFIDEGGNQRGPRKRAPLVSDLARPLRSERLAVRCCSPRAPARG